MQATTWVDRITDDKNPWLNAVRAEERRDFAAAFLLYLEDSSARLKQGQLARAALSCTCAAGCVTALGFPEEAKLIYAEAASLYYENARRVTAVSIRELLWSLLRSAQSYAAASQLDNANAVYREYSVVARRVDPFLDGGMDPVTELTVPASETSLRPSPADAATVMRGIEAFLSAARSERRPGRARMREAPHHPDRRGNRSYEASFANQLG